MRARVSTDASACQSMPRVGCSGTESATSCRIVGRSVQTGRQDNTGPSLSPTFRVDDRLRNRLAPKNELLQLWVRHFSHRSVWVSALLGGRELTPSHQRLSAVELTEPLIGVMYSITSHSGGIIPSAMHVLIVHLMMASVAGNVSPPLLMPHISAASSPYTRLN